jgi:integrase/recombinase XerC
MPDKEVRSHLKHLRLEGKSELTMYHRERALLRLAAFLPVPLLDADDAMLYDWRASLRVSDAAAAGYISHVKEFYKWAHKRGLIESSPATELPVPKLGRRQPRPIPDADLMKAVADASGTVRIWLVLAAWCGLRAKEIAGLRAENIRLRDRKPVIIVASDATKGTAERTIDLCDFARAELAACRLPVTGHAWTYADGRPVRPWWVSKLCNAYLHEHGIASTLHCLRGWFATTAYAESQDIIAVQEMMGHASIETTRPYIRHGSARNKAIVGRLPVPPLGRAS